MTVDGLRREIGISLKNWSIKTKDQDVLRGNAYAILQDTSW